MKDKYSRKIEIAIGLSFIIATICYAAGSGMVSSALVAGDVSRQTFGMGVLLEIINSLAVIAIGILMFERFKSYNKTLVTGYVITRAVEAVLLIVGSLIAFLAVEVGLGSNLNAIILAHDLFFGGAMLVLGVYSTIFFFYLFKKSMGPKWMMALGGLGYLLTSVYAVITIVTGFEVNPLILFAPGGIFELLFPILLVFKGIHD